MKPDYHETEEFQNRNKKLEELKELGINSYPSLFHPTHTTGALHKEYGEQTALGFSEDAAQGKTPQASVAGRLVLFRAMGKNIFAHIQDSSGRIQIMLNRDITQVTGYTPSDPEAPTPLKLIEKKIDLGDIIGIEGHLFFTHKGELTLFAHKVTILCKSLLPLPDKHCGLHDKEARYRKRWLDLISNSDVMKTFQQRSEILSIVRTHFKELSFLEVETPILGSLYGGAQAKPFTTTLNALDQEMFMRISLEISLKKLLVGGLDRIFEIGKVFRNEGIDRTHNPEFTMLEAYAAYWDYEAMMHVTETLFEKIALQLFQTTEVPVYSPDLQETITINFKAPWIRLSMKGSLEKYANIVVDSMSDEEMRTHLIEKAGLDPLEVKSLCRGLLIASLFEAFVEDKLIQPHHIIDHPIETTPLCKPHRDPLLRKEGIIERFESFILGKEICNAYSELNDPLLQRSLLEQQADQRAQGDEEASPLDEEFIEAICQGMPPAGGLGIGIDRLVMLFTNSSSIRDVLFFPWMKPKQINEELDTIEQ
jgi:lysyl-tRNA synthetase class 2